MPQIVLAAFLIFIGYCYVVGNPEMTPEEIAERDTLWAQQDEDRAARAAALAVEIGLE